MRNGACKFARREPVLCFARPLFVAVYFCLLVNRRPRKSCHVRFVGKITWRYPTANVACNLPSFYELPGLAFDYAGWCFLYACFEFSKRRSDFGRNRTRLSFRPLGVRRKCDARRNCSERSNKNFHSQPSFGKCETPLKRYPQSSNASKIAAATDSFCSRLANVRFTYSRKPTPPIRHINEGRIKRPFRRGRGHRSWRSVRESPAAALRFQISANPPSRR